MKINFNIDYKTQWGETLYICGNDSLLGSGNIDAALKMHVDGVGLWTATVDISDKNVRNLEYGYVGWLLS